MIRLVTISAIVAMLSLVQLPLSGTRAQNQTHRTATRHRARHTPPWPPKCSPEPPTKDCPSGLECIDRRCIPTETASTLSRQVANNSLVSSLLLDIGERLRAFTFIGTRIEMATHWVPWNSRRSGLPADAVAIGADKGRPGDPITYVCRGELQGAGTLPGKVVAGRCNVAWGRREFLLTDYEVAVSTVGCWGWPKAEWGAWLRAGSWNVCRSYYKADRGFHIGGGDLQIDYGWQGGRLEGHSCTFGWDGGSRTVVLPEVFYPTCPAELRHPPSSGPTTTPSDPRITSITISPSPITAGAETTLTVILDRPAPSGGFAVGISHVTNTGTDDVIVNMPTSMQFTQGASSFPFIIRTQRRTSRRTDILFTAFHNTDQRSVNLFIDP